MTKYTFEYIRIFAQCFEYIQIILGFEQNGCMSYGPKILREHSPPLVSHVKYINKKRYKIVLKAKYYTKMEKKMKININLRDYKTK